MQKNLSRPITSDRYNIFSWSFFILKIALRFIQPFKNLKLCKIANFPHTDTLIGFTRTLFLYLSRVALLEQINVLRHQVFVVLKRHKISLFLSDLFNCTDVRFLFQYGVGLELRRQARAVSFGPTNYEECLHRSGVSE